MGTIVAASVIATIPLLFAGIAGVVASRSGVLNIGLEGLLLSGAFAAAWATAATESEILGVAFTLAVGGALGLLLGLVTVGARADQVVTGIAFNLLALGVTSFLFDIITNNQGLSALSVGSPGSRIRLPGLASLPWLGPVFNQHWLAYVAYITVPIVSLAIFRTGLGVRLRSCGEFAEGAQATGVPVLRVRVLAMTVSGTLAALGGAYLVLGDIRLFQQNASGGRGYIAIAIIILGRWTPYGAFVAAAAFGTSVALSFQLQAKGVPIPGELLLALPYIVTLVAVVAAGGRARPPIEEGKPLYLAR